MSSRSRSYAAESTRSSGFHLVHQLEANQFFIDLAAATRGLPDCGLYHWVGEHAVENAYAEGDDRAPIPDGWGRLLTPDREVLIHLEWDRGTEQRRRLRAKLATYAGYFNDRPGAGANQILFVAPTQQRERQILGLFRDHADSDRESCGFWTTTTAFISAAGVIGEVWAGGGSSRRVPFRIWPDCLGRTVRSTRASASLLGGCEGQAEEEGRELHGVRVRPPNRKESSSGRGHERARGFGCGSVGQCGTTRLRRARLEPVRARSTSANFSPDIGRGLTAQPVRARTAWKLARALEKKPSTQLSQLLGAA